MKHNKIVVKKDGKFYAKTEDDLIFCPQCGSDSIKKLDCDWKEGRFYFGVLAQKRIISDRFRCSCCGCEFDKIKETHIYCRKLIILIISLIAHLGSLLSIIIVGVLYQTEDSNFDEFTVILGFCLWLASCFGIGEAMM